MTLPIVFEQMKGKHFRPQLRVLTSTELVTIRINMFSYSCKLDQYKMILYLLIVTTPT